MSAEEKKETKEVKDEDKKKKKGKKLEPYVESDGFFDLKDYEQQN